MCAITSYFPFFFFFVLVWYRLQLLDSEQSRLACIVPDISSCDTPPPLQKWAWSVVLHEDQQLWSLWILLENIVIKMHLHLPQLLGFMKKKTTSLLQLSCKPKGWVFFWVEYFIKGCDFPGMGPINSDLFHYLPPHSSPVIMNTFTICS